ncbi:RraA family protein, partial [Steroidobacter sp.]|uniref:RraA family protein n=1 Tax=Steroidobacter sp. TaxID=1978227 RepID=UPI001A3E34E9
MKQSIELKHLPAAVPAEILQDFKDVPTALLADTDDGVVSLGQPLVAMTSKTCFIGEALTISTGSMAQWKALEMARRGHVLIIAAQGRPEAEFGAIYVHLALQKGIAAIVTDGLIRDREEIARLDIPVFACGSHPSSPADATVGRVGYPIDLQGVRIEAGEVIVGDDDGVAIVPHVVLTTVRDKLTTQRKR